MKPLIGVSTFIGWEHNRIFVKLGQYYTLAVEAGGGMAVCVPSHVDTEQAAEYVSRLDGIVFSGGRADIQPHHYGELPTTGFSTVDPVRDAWEFALYKAALEQGKPVLGICRGAQVINVAGGGTLFQDLPSQFEGVGEHLPSASEMHHLFHPVFIEEDCKLAEILGDGELMINSFHHQAVKDVAPGFKATAHSGEGVIEAIESEEHPFVLGVQWHPEALVIRHPEFVKLFSAFVDACR